MVIIRCLLYCNEFFQNSRNKIDTKKKQHNNLDEMHWEKQCYALIVIQRVWKPGPGTGCCCFMVLFFIDTIVFSVRQQPVCTLIYTLWMGVVWLCALGRMLPHSEVTVHHHATPLIFELHAHTKFHQYSRTECDRTASGMMGAYTNVHASTPRETCTHTHTHTRTQAHPRILVYMHAYAHPNS